MGTNDRKANKQYFNISFTVYTIIADLYSSMWMIISISLSLSCFAYIQRIESYKPYYTVDSVYMVRARGINNDLITAMNTSQERAKRFTEILNSSALMRKVSEETGYDVEHIYYNAAVIGETNLVKITAYGKNPEYAFNIFQAIKNNYAIITDSLVKDATISVLQEVSVSTKPSYEISPVKTMIIYFVICGMILTSFVIVLSCFKDTIRTGQDVEKKLDTQYLGEICHEEKVKKNKKVAKDSLLITKTTISFRYVEGFHRIARRVRRALDKEGHRSLLITSCLENEGKSTIAANLAISLAGQGKRIALVDFDLRRPAQYKIFGLRDNEISEIGDYLNGRKGFEAVLGKIEGIEVYTVFNSRAYVQSTEMLTIGNVKGLLEYLQEKHDYIIIDSPPLELAADAEVLAAFSDATLLVVKEHLARAKEINDNLDILYNCRAQVIGCVVNNVHNNVIGAIGGHGYSNSKYEYHYGYYNRSAE